MRIETGHAKAVVSTSDGAATVSMDRALGGFAARVQMPTMYQRCYVCVRRGEALAHLFVVTGEEWKQDIIDTGFMVVGELGEMIQQALAVTDCDHKDHTCTGDVVDGTCPACGREWGGQDE